MKAWAFSELVRHNHHGDYVLSFLAGEDIINQWASSVVKVANVFRALRHFVFFVIKALSGSYVARPIGHGG